MKELPDDVRPYRWYGLIFDEVGCYIYLQEAIIRGGGYAVLKERPDEAVYCFDYRTLKLKPKATTFQDIVRDAWRACNLKALYKRM